jgi:hypothetical protein
MAGAQSFARAAHPARPIQPVIRKYIGSQGKNEMSARDSSGMVETVVA